MSGVKAAIVFSCVELWFLHGLDMQYYTIQNDYLFDINLFLAVMTNIIIVVLLIGGQKNLNKGTLNND